MIGTRMTRMRRIRRILYLLFKYCKPKILFLFDFYCLRSKQNPYHPPHPCHPRSNPWVYFLKIYPTMFFNYKTFFTKSLTEFNPRTTSLSPIANAAKVGVSNPIAAIGIATTLYTNAQKRFCLMVR